MRTRLLFSVPLASILATPAAAQQVDDEATDAAQAEKEAEEEADFLTFGGALRLAYVYADWVEASRKRGGDLALDTFRINVDGELDGWLLSAEYRFYAGFQLLHHGWFGYRLGEDLVLRAGVTQVPFGLLPYASHNWFFQLPYYVGLEDDQDAGIVAAWDPGPLRLHVAYFKNDEGSFIGSSADSARYGYDVVTEQPSDLVRLDTSNRETNQVNGRLAWVFETGDLDGELGVSGQWGQLYDAEADRFGHRWAAAAHLDATWRRWNLKAEVVAYGFQPVRDPAGVVAMGAYDAPYLVAKWGTIYVAGLSYLTPLELGPVDSVTLYDDFSVLDKRVEGFEDSWQHVAGALIQTGPISTYVDLASGRNQPFIGPNYGTALAAGGGGWYTRLNVNFGYYF